MSELTGDIEFWKGRARRHWEDAEIHASNGRHEEAAQAKENAARVERRVREFEDELMMESENA